MTKKQDELLSHNYDGIEEYDNSLPLWWRWLFYLTIVFAVVYVAYYHLGSGLNQEQTLALEMKTIADQKPKATGGELTEEQLLAKVSDPTVVAKGKEVFQARCLACHGPLGGGIVGPNLTDDHWIHGGKLLDIRNTIMEGVPAKGMISWKALMPAEEVDAVVAYIRSIRGTNPPGGKPPEGEVVSNS